MKIKAALPYLAVVFCLLLTACANGGEIIGTLTDDGSGSVTADAGITDEETAVPSSVDETVTDVPTDTTAGKDTEPEETTAVGTETEPSQTTVPDTEAPEETTERDVTAELKGTAREYSDYCALSPDGQIAFYGMFGSPDAFLEWYNKAKAAYESANPAIVIGPGEVIDIGG